MQKGRSRIKKHPGTESREHLEKRHRQRQDDPEEIQPAPPPLGHHRRPLLSDSAIHLEQHPLQLRYAHRIHAEPHRLLMHVCLQIRPQLPCIFPLESVPFNPRIQVFAQTLLSLFRPLVHDFSPVSDVLAPPPPPMKPLSPSEPMPFTIVSKCPDISPASFFPRSVSE